jgi:hypothetical protein
VDAVNITTSPEKMTSCKKCISCTYNNHELCFMCEMCHANLSDVAVTYIAEEKETEKECVWCTDIFVGEDSDRCRSCISRGKELMLAEKHISSAEKEVVGAQNMLNQCQERLKVLGAIRMDAVESKEYDTLVKNLPHRLSTLKYAQSGVQGAKKTLKCIQDN